jgi:hypothetical protein
MIADFFILCVLLWVFAWMGIEICMEWIWSGEYLVGFIQGNVMPIVHAVLVLAAVVVHVVKMTGILEWR